MGTVDRSTTARASENGHRAKALLTSGLLSLTCALAMGQARAAGWPERDLDGGSSPPGLTRSRAGLDTLAPSRGPAPTVSALDGLTVGTSNSRSVAPTELASRLALLDVAPRPGKAVARHAGPIEPVVLTSPIVSGLGWRSGATYADAAFSDWRGRPVDVVHSFIPHRTWDEMKKQLQGRLARYVDNAPQISVSLVLFPDSEVGVPADRPRKHAACARGEFDSHFRRFGELLVQGGAGDAVVRIGHEPNAGSDNHPWSIDTAAEVDNYKACFRSEALALKSTAPRARIEWTSAKRGQWDFSVLDAYPGGDVVDIVGINSYDRGPQYVDQRTWDQIYMKTRHGGPVGYGAWVQAARRLGKKLAVSEWGVWDWDGNGPVDGDNPFYIQKMYEFFKANAADIEYETYYNYTSKHQLYPNSPFPRSSNKYRQLWSAGQ